MTGLDERPSRLGSGRSTGRTLVYVSVALAVAAAAVLVLGFDDARLLRLGVVAALWAALAGSVAAVRMRREVTSSGGQAEDLRSIYQLELEREVAARREHELTVERDLRRDIEQGSRAELDALRKELRTLRENLESVLDGELLVERVALRAETTRMRSLSDQVAPTTNVQPAPTVPPDRTGRRATAAQPPSAPSPSAQPPSAPHQGRGDGSNPPQRAAGLPRRDPAARADPARRARPENPPRPGGTRYADDPLFGDVPWRPDVNNGNGMAGTAPHGNGAYPGNGVHPGNGQGRGPAGPEPRRAPEEPDGAHTGGRSVEDLLAAYGASAAPPRHRRRDDG